MLLQMEEVVGLSRGLCTNLAIVPEYTSTLHCVWDLSSPNPGELQVHICVRGT